MIRYLEGGISPRQFADLTDAQIWSIYFRKRDENGKLVRYGKRTEPHEEAKPLSDEELGIPAEAFTLDQTGRIDSSFVQMFWAVERSVRRRSVAETMAKWRVYVERELSGQGKGDSKPIRRRAP